MTLSDIAKKLFGAKRAETTSKTSDVSTLQGTVVSDSENGHVEVAFDADCTTLDGTNVVSIGTLASLKEGDQAIVMLEGGGVKRPTAIGAAGWGDRIQASIVETNLLIADKADIEDLEAANAHIGNLEADNLTINNRLEVAETSIGTLEADNATINGKLTAAEADIDTLQANSLTADSATIKALEADTAKVHDLSAQQLNATVGYIEDLTSENITATDLTATHAYIADLEADNITASDLSATHAYIADLEADNITAQDLSATHAYIADLEADNVTAQNLIADHAEVGSLDANYAQIDLANIANGTITTAMIGDAQINSAKIANGSIENADIKNGTIENAKIKDGTIETAKIKDAAITTAKIGDAQITTAKIGNAAVGTANIKNAAITNALIANEAVSSSQILSVSANKLTAGTINAAEIDVTNLHASSLIVDKLNGQPVLGGYAYVNKNISGYSSKNPSQEGWYEMTANGFALSTDTSVDSTKAYYTQGNPTKLYDQDYIDGLEEGLNQRIDGAIETFTGDHVPTLNTYPAVDWTTDDAKSAHVGDIYFVTNAALNEDGYNYRFAYDNATSSYRWVLIKDSDVTKALQDITDLQDFESDTTSWINETDQGLVTIRQNHTALSGVVDKTVKESVQLWYTKADTTAPGKPTSQVTSTSTAGNAWRTVVPAWNASYPNYYYCWQYKLADNTYAWSDVVRDIAMGESQGTSRSAQTTANANIKSSVQLWFTKANSTAPSKPTSQVTTNNAATGNAWNLAVPTYNASYPHYFYCYQQQKGDGTYQWSDVVYDKGTTEAMQKAQAALPSSTFTTFQSTTFKNLVDEVDEQSSTINQMTETIQYGGVNLIPNTGVANGYYANTKPSGDNLVEADDGGACFERTGCGTAEQIVFSSDIAREDMKQGVKYTMTLMVKSTVARSFALQLRKNSDGADGGNYWANSSAIAVPANAWTQLKGTFTASANQSVYARLYMAAGTACNVRVRNLQLERGEIATEWSPSAVDLHEVSNTVNSVKQTATANTASISGLTTTTQALRTDLDNLDVGGRNLVLRTGSSWRIPESGTASSQYTFRKWAVQGLPFASGEQVTVSGNVVVESGSAASLGIRFYDEPTTTSYTTEGQAPISDGRFKLTLTVSSVLAGKTDAYLLIYAGPFGSTSGNAVTISNLKLERGNVATDWSPAPEDVQGSITTLESRSSKIEQTLDGFSSTVGAIVDETVVGTNILTGNALNPYNWTISAPTGANYTKTAYGTAGVKVQFKAVGGCELFYSPAITVVNGKKYTLSVEYTVGKDYIIASGKGGFGLSVYKAVPTASYDNANANFLARAQFFETATRVATKATVTFTATSNTVYLGLNGGQIQDSSTVLEFTLDKLTLVENIASRMSSAETSITQNSSAISLNAKKSEQATNMLADFNAPTLAAVNGKTGRYFSDNSSYRTGEVITISDPPEPWIVTGGRISTTGTTHTTNSQAKSGLVHYGYDGAYVTMTEGESYTFSFWARKVSGTCAWYCMVGSGPYVAKGDSGSYQVSNDLGTGWTYIEFPFTYTSASCGGNGLGCRVYPGIVFKAGTAGVGEVCGAKVTRGSYASQAELKVQSDRIGMVVSNADASSTLALTSGAMTYIGNHVEIKDTAGTSTVISGGKLQTNLISVSSLKDSGNYATKTDGRNRVCDTSSPAICEVNTTTSFQTFALYSTDGNATYADNRTLADLGFKSGDNVTLSFDWSTAANGSNAITYGTFWIEWYGRKADGSNENAYLAKLGDTITMSSSNASGHYSKTVALNATSVLSKRLVLRSDKSVLVITVKNLKLERGSEETAYSTALEDGHGFKYLDSSYTNPLATIKSWAEENKDAGNWNVSSTAGVQIGDTVYIKTVPSDNYSNPVYVILSVTSITSATAIRGISHGYLDTASTVSKNVITSVVDFNDYKTTGLFYIKVSGNTNSPTTGHGLLEVNVDVGTPYQIWQPDATTTAYYKRQYKSNAWSTWTAIDGKGAYDLANKANSKANAWRGTLGTDGSTAAKLVACDGFESSHLVSGTTISVYCASSGHAVNGKITLNVNSTGAKDVWVAGAVTSDTNRIYWAYGCTLTFTYDGTNWRLGDNPPALYAKGYESSAVKETCETAEGTAQKNAMVDSFVCFKGATMSVPMKNSNTSTSMSIKLQNSSGTGFVANVYHGSSTNVPTKANGLAWPAGETVIFTYDGKFWRTGNQTFIDGGNIITGKVSADRINVSGINIGDLNGSLGGRNLVTGTSNTWKELTTTNTTNQTIALFSNFDVTAIPGIAVGDAISVSFDIAIPTATTRGSNATQNIQGNVNRGGSTWTGANFSSTGGSLSAEILDVFTNKKGKHVRLHTYFTVTAAMLNGTVTGNMDCNIRFDYWTGKVMVRRVMVERGKMASEWMPAPEEMAATATNYISADSSGIRIANANPSSATTYQHQTASATEFYVSGKKRQVTNANGLEVFDSDGQTSLAKFGSTMRVGKAAGGNVKVDDDSVDVCSGSTTLVSMKTYDNGQGQALDFGAGATNYASILHYASGTSANENILNLWSNSGGDNPGKVVLTASGSGGVSRKISVSSKSGLIELDGTSYSVTSPSEFRAAISAQEAPSSIGINKVLASPSSGSAGAASYRALVAADIPSLAASKIGSGTLPVARGGTNKTSGEFFGATRIYSSTATCTTFTLTASAANYSWLTILYKGNDGFYDSVTVFNNKAAINVALSVIESTANGCVNIKRVTYQISGTSATVKTYGEADMANNAVVTASAKNVTVTGVWGWV